MVTRFLALLVGVALAPAALAAPISRSVTLGVSIEWLNGPASASLDVSAATTVTVDDVLGTIAIPGVVFLSGSPVTVPFVQQTFFGGTQALAWTASNLGLAGGTLVLGGATTQAPAGEGPCPEVGGAFACVVGGGLGGNVPLTGAIGISIVSVSFAIPLQMSTAPFGHASQTSGPGPAFSFGDGGPFTTGVARIGFDPASSPFSRTRTGHIGFPASSLTLVAPTFIEILGGATPFATSLTITFTDGGGLPAFVPEPAAAGLILAGAVGLAVLALTRRA